MRTRDTFDVACSAAAVAADAVAVFAGFLLAFWIRFDSGWIPVTRGYPSRIEYDYGALIATLLFLLVFRSVGLYVRPQLGAFGDRIPRLIRSAALGMLLAVAFWFAIRTSAPFSRIMAGLSLFTITALVLIERFVLFQYERHIAKHREEVNRVLVIGTDAVAARLKTALKHEPRLRSRVTGFLRTSVAEPDPSIPPELLKGGIEDLERFIERGDVDQVILADTSLPHDRMVQIILQCERAMVSFLLVPDLFGVLTSRVDVCHVGDIPLLGVGKWPLDFFWKRVAKRAEDIVGSMVGLLVSVPIVIIAAPLIKRSSPGPVFFRQERCGEGGQAFHIHKLRTMPVNAENDTGPVWATEGDPRRTPVGRFLRRHNLDELPQFWNVLKGEMSLVGPRPERPHFVEQFKDDISRYMWRHVSKPGMTGWAQVNGLRGQTSIRERIQYDLYYLENWSLSFDFKILAKTFFTRKNAY